MEFCFREINEKEREGALHGAQNQKKPVLKSLEFCHLRKLKKKRKGKSIMPLTIISALKENVQSKCNETIKERSVRAELFAEQVTLLLSC